MPCQSQLTANRANSQKSTGPATPRPPASMPSNTASTPSPSPPGEDPAAYQQVAVDYNRLFHPQNVLEEFHVDTLIRCDWQKRRLQHTEAKIYRVLIAEGPDPKELDIAVLPDSPTAKLLRRVTAQIAALGPCLLPRPERSSPNAARPRPGNRGRSVAPRPTAPAPGSHSPRA